MMNKEAKLLFLLLRVALSDAKSHVDDLKSVAWGSVDWHGLYLLAREQGVVAIAFDGIQKIFDAEIGVEVDMPKMLKLQWISHVSNIENGYRKQYAIAKELSEAWAESGIRTVCLKGLVFSLYYPVPHHRECGDFDCYLMGQYDLGNRVAKQLGAKVDVSWYKHSQISYKGVLCENHKYCVTTRKGEESRILDKVFKELLHTVDSERYIPNTKIIVPTTEFNLLFMAYHTFAHFLVEGISFRHLLDWGLLVQKEENNIDWDLFYSRCEQLRYLRFVEAITDIVVSHLGIKLSNPKIRMNATYSDKILDSIIYENSKVFSSGKGKWQNRFKVILNLFKYNWKYKEIYCYSSFRRLYDYIIGFILQRE